MNATSCAASSFRRRFLKTGAIYLGAALAGPGLARHAGAAANASSNATANTSATPVPPAASGTRYQWRNWSGTEQCVASSLQTPGNEAEIAQLLRQSSGTIRCVGAAHSFSGLVPTEGSIISLDRFSGIGRVDPASHTVTVAAGTRLALLSRQLDSAGFAMRNLPDIDQQSLAGAISSATHGTGATLSALHADVVALKLVTAQGEILTCSEQHQPDLLAAARVSLGSLGVITEATVRVVPAYNLQRRVWIEPLDALLDKALQLSQQHRHFEFYYLPFTGYAAAIAHDIYTGSDILMPAAKDEEMLADLQKLRDWSGRYPALRRWLAGKLIDTKLDERAKNRSYKLLANPRPTRFYETESHVPREAGVACVRAIIARLEQNNDVFFPLEFRFVKGDDAWLSPFYQRDSCSIAVHALHGEPYRYLTEQLGPIIRRFGARPHWGKLHAFNAQELAALYPRWGDFLALRAKLDPKNRLINPHLRQLFGIPA
jgi:FAD-linked oxidoreductase